MRRSASRRLYPWLVPAAFAAHTAEELPRFPRWATEHFGTTTTRFYVVSHAILLPLVAASAAAGAGSGRDGRGAFFAASVAACLVTNALFHVVTTALFRRYSPGLVTALLCVLPSGTYVISRARREALLSDGRLTGAILAGNALSAAVIASLYVDMPRLGGPLP